MVIQFEIKVIKQKLLYKNLLLKNYFKYTIYVVFKQ